MRRLFLNFAVILLGAMAVFTSCEEKIEDPDADLKDYPNEVIVKTNITGTRNWVKDSVYILIGQINVEGTLNVAPGTIVKGDKVTKGTLVVVPGGKLNAQGTASQPIVFTSRMEPGSRAAGDWGGIIMVGKATVNQTNATVEGLSNPVDYGTSAIPVRDDNDNSGILQYVRIEFSGIALQPDKETNGLTMCAVGKATTISHVQVSYGGDDSFEWFGGNVNCKYLIGYLGLDDDWDVDYGYSGNVQFGLSVRNPRTADVSGSNGFESDNDGSGSTASPKTSAVFSNMTVIGPFKTTADKDVNLNYASGMHLRRNTSISIFNSVIAGWNTAGLLLDATTTYANATNGDMALQNVAIVGIKGTVLKGASSVTDTNVADFFNTPAFNNQLIVTVADAKIANAFYNPKAAVGTPVSFLPEAGSPLLGAGAFAHAKLQNAFFDKTATYMGAFGAADWTAQAWVNFDPQNTIYR
ncbi:MAG: hypothetical protein VB066_02470 [Paludibacter sp.]|nr:hypothetical protein [Paludibacter sp.]